ncbi:MAG TPA: RDD family protein [Candidatus Dormibacteraeota bacterium]|nr:RDD family protein [Candidatus Dormibacteraeota bacterium]
MAVAAVTSARSERAEYARDARPARFLALILDSVALAFILLVANNVFGVTHVETWPQITIGAGPFTTSIPVPAQWLIGFLYFAIPEAMFGATPGKQWMRLKVVRLDGQRIGVREVVVRNILRLVDGFPFLYLLGAISVLNTNGAQRIGDMAGGTTVVFRHRALQPGATLSSTPSAHRALGLALAVALIFTVAFAYFGHPPLVIAGDFNQRLIFGRDVISYSLGTPTWGPGTVTYPITLTKTNAHCSGTVSLRWWWESLGWQPNGESYDCSP